jgi:hypothetical protein
MNLVIGFWYDTHEHRRDNSMKRKRCVIAAAAYSFFIASMVSAQNPSPAEVQEIAERAYIYAYPLVLLQATMAALPVNHLVHVSAFPDASFRLIVRPNADTLYTNAWIDVSKEPMLLHVPDSAGRFYLLQFMDAWTETFADPGKRTTGTAEAWFAIVGPGWHGDLPSHVTRLDAPTNQVWLLGRTQTNGAADYDNVHAFQHGMRLVPLSQYPGTPQMSGGDVPPSQAAAGPPPPDRIKAMEPAAFFAAFAQAMKANPPHPADAPLLHDLARIGIVPGEDFDPSKLSPDQVAALNQGVRAAMARIEQFVGSAASVKPGWTSFQGTIGRYGTNYMARAVTARIAVGANPAEDAVYITSSADAAGQPLNGSARYRMHFDAFNLPPVLAFWSVTAYDKDGYFIANPINRYAIGDRDPLKFNPDGSLDLYIQSQDPGPDRRSNWLPSGDGVFNLTLRLYWPKPAILNRTWQPPALESLP